MTIKQGLAPTGEITDEMLDEVIGKIADALNNNTLCMASIDKMRDLMEVLPDGSEAVKEELRGSENDMHAKLVTALAIYIAYQNEDIKDKMFSLKLLQLQRQPVLSRLM